MPVAADRGDPASGAIEALRCRSLLERLLRTLDAERATDWADRLTDEFRSVGAVLAASPERLSQVCRARDEVGTFLDLIRETVLEALRQQLLAGPLLPDMGALLDYAQADLAHRKAEELRVFYLDARLRLIRDERSAVGTVDRLRVYPREIIRRSLELGATGLILIHNHPSGHIRPSADDVRTTRELRTATAPIGIELHDHLIVSPAGWTSLRAENLL